MPSTPSPLSAALALIAAWAVLGLPGLARPHSIGFVVRTLFPLGAACLIAPEARDRDRDCSGVFGESYASCGRVSNVIPVDVAVPGCPPTPTRLLEGILAAFTARPASPPA